MARERASELVGERGFFSHLVEVLIYLLTWLAPTCLWGCKFPPEQSP